jgi:tight adherence protein B
MDPVILGVGGGIIILLLIVGVYITYNSEKSAVEERLEIYLEEDVFEFEHLKREEEDDREVEGVLTRLLDRIVQGTDYGSKISQELAQANIKLKPGEYTAIMILSIIGTAAFGFFFGGGIDQISTSVIFAAGGGFLGSRIPRMVVRRQQDKRLKAFNDQLSDMLTLMVNGLRAGFATMQSLEAVSKQLPAPISIEFRRVIQEMQLGLSMEESLENLIRRIPSPDLDLVITAMNVQREVGGNLAEILETISHTIRERIRIKGEIKTITAQVVYSGRFLSFLPVALAAALWFLNRDYMMELFKEPAWCGYALLGCSGLLIIAGYIIMNKIGDIEI